jgi:hypothetical protein
MGLSTHLGPWLVGTQKDTTGTTAGTIRNLGTTVAAQVDVITAAKLAAATTATRAFVLPAGAIIIGAQFYATTTVTTGSTATIKLSLNGTDITAATTISGTAGVFGLTLSGTGATAAGLLANVGTTDAIITYTTAAVTGGAGTLLIEYAVRLADGTYTPTSFTA